MSAAPEHPLVRSVRLRCATELARIDRGRAAPPGDGRAFAQLCEDLGALDRAGLWPELMAAVLHRPQPDPRLNVPLARVLLERAQDGYVNPTGGKTTGRERKDG